MRDVKDWTSRKWRSIHGCQKTGNNKERGTKSDLRPSAVKIITRKRREKEQRKLRSNTSVQFLCHF